MKKQWNRLLSVLLSFVMVLGMLPAVTPHVHAEGTGEIVLIDYTNHLAITGDIYINMQGLTPEQAAYNQYAPILMTSVDTDPKLCAQERKAIMQRLGVGQWQIFGAHGFKKDYAVNA